MWVFVIQTDEPESYRPHGLRVATAADRAALVEELCWWFREMNGREIDLPPDATDKQIVAVVKSAAGPGERWAICNPDGDYLK